MVSSHVQIDILGKSFGGIITLSCLELTNDLIWIAVFIDTVWNNNGFSVYIVSIIASPDRTIFPDSGFFRKISISKRSSGKTGRISAEIYVVFPPHSGQMFLSGYFDIVIMGIAQCLHHCTLTGVSSAVVEPQTGQIFSFVSILQLLLYKYPHPRCLMHIENCEIKSIITELSMFQVSPSV